MRVSIPSLRHAAIAVGVLLAALAVGRGVSDTTPLVYSGTVLTSAGAPITTQQSISIRLFDVASGGTAKCTTSTTLTPSSTGAFSVSLDPSCVAAVSDNPALWVEVTVGATTLPRTRLGATPYALEAANAVRQVVKTDAGTLSLNGLFCGSTTAQPGNFGGYVAARNTCVSVCGSPSAHPCNNHEALNSHYLGVFPASTFHWVSLNAALQTTSSDCQGWTNATTSQNGYLFGGTLGFSGDLCSTPRPLACCD